MLEERKLVSRRTLLRGAGLGGVGLIAAYFVGCGDDDDDGGGVTTASPGATAGATTPPAQQLALVDGWYRDQPVRYYDFGMNSPASGNTVATAPIYVFITGMDASGNPIMVEGQHNVVDTVPGDGGYSDLWQVTLVTVPEDYVGDTVKSKAEIDDAGYDTQAVDMFVNCPIVPEGSTLEGGEPLVQGWYKGDAVFYPDFGLNPPVALPIFAFITGMDADGNPQFAEGQSNIIDSIPDDEGYSAFWRVTLVTVPAGYEGNSIKSAADAVDSGYEMTQTDLVVNCPVTVF